MFYVYSLTYFRPNMPSVYILNANIIESRKAFFSSSCSSVCMFQTSAASNFRAESATLHGNMSQKKALYIVSAMITGDLTCIYSVFKVYS